MNKEKKSPEKRKAGNEPEAVKGTNCGEQVIVASGKETNLKKKIWLISGSDPGEGKKISHHLRIMLYPPPSKSLRRQCLERAGVI
ncbi:unnamed protein product [Allacma fusca]|uniref:Uncharacterized protein n=1 Tax=Allacma fusca TaxID=39272 RepID=A0A8J2KAK7_9HEXA|nr:unnamed protein product [Allacma fusca]